MNKHQDEFIGKRINILESKNIAQQGIQGVVVDETQNTFTIKTKEKKIMIMKQNKTFKIGEFVLDGNKIMKRPEDRIKIKEK